jgi:MFS family permease
MNTARLRIYAAAFCMDATSYGAFLLLPIGALKIFDADPLELGLIGTIINGTYTIVCILTGRLSDRVGSRALYLPGAVIVFAVALPIVYFSSSLGQLFLAAPILGIGLGFFWAPLERELGQASGSRSLWKTAANFNCVWAGGICLGTYLSPGIYEQLGFKAGVLLLLVLSGSALALLAPPLRMEPPIENSKREPIKVETGSAHLLLVAWVANFSAYFAIIGITNQLPYLGEKHLGINMAMVGLLALSINVARLGGFFTLRWFSGWNHSPGWLFAAQLAAAGALLTLSQASDPACYFILLPVLGIFSSLSYSLSFFYGLTTPSRAGKNSGLHEAVLSLGLMTGPLVCGAAANALPDWPAVALAVAGGALLLALTVELTIMKIYRGRKEPGC